MSRRSPLTKKDLLTGDNRIRRFSSLSKRDKYCKVKEHTADSVGVWSDETLKQVELAESLGAELDFGMPEVMGVKFSEAIEETGSTGEDARVEFARRIPSRYYSPSFQSPNLPIYWEHHAKEHVLKAKGPEDILLKYDRFCELRDFLEKDSTDGEVVFGEYIADNADHIRRSIPNTQRSHETGKLGKILNSNENACSMFLIDDLTSRRHADAILNSTSKQLRFALSNNTSSYRLWSRAELEKEVIRDLGYVDPCLPEIGEFDCAAFNEVQGRAFDVICASHVNSPNKRYCDYKSMLNAMSSVLDSIAYSKPWLFSQVADMLREYTGVLDSQSVMIAFQCVETPEMWISCSSREEAVAFMKKYHEQGKLHLFVNLLSYIVMEYDNALPNTSRYLRIEDKAMILDPCLIMGMIGSSKPRVIDDDITKFRERMRAIVLR